MSIALCIYHGGCDDGFGAAYAMWKALGEKVEFYPGVHQEEPPPVEGRDVFLLDFSYKRGVIESLLNKAKSITILDHHISAQKDLDELLEAGAIKGQFDMHRSGAMMAWDYFMGTEAPPLIQHIQDRDLWKFELAHTRCITMALGSYEQDFETWDSLMYQTEQLAQEGAAIERWYRRRVENAKKHAWLEDIGGYKVPVICAPNFMASDLAGELSQDHPFAAIYWDSENHRNYSLRSRGDFDVSQVARQFGGGGHKQAAGFKIPRKRE